MAVRVGSARHDENGKLKGGKPGMMENWHRMLSNDYTAIL